MSLSILLGIIIFLLILITYLMIDFLLNYKDIERKKIANEREADKVRMEQYELLKSIDEIQGRILTQLMKN